VRLLTERTQIHGMASRSPPTIERLRTAAPIERLRTWPSRSLSQFAYQCFAADGKLVAYLDLILRLVVDRWIEREGENAPESGKALGRLGGGRGVPSHCSQ
jgi:hypothetical protein